MTDQYFEVSCWNDYLTYVKAFTLQYVARRPYGRQVNMDNDLRGHLMPEEVGMIFFFHKFFKLFNYQHPYMLFDLKHIVVPALVQETALLECVTLPRFSSQHIRNKCKPRMLLLYISCLGNVWEVLCELENAVHLSELLGSGSLMQHQLSSTLVKDANTMHDSLFMGAVVRCILNNEGYATLLLFAITEHYGYLFQCNHRSFSILNKKSLLSAKQAERLEPLATIAKEAMITTFGAWNGGPSIKVKSQKGLDITFHNKQVYAISLGLYNLWCDMEGEELFLWDNTVLSRQAEHPNSRSAEDFLNEVNMMSANVENICLHLNQPMRPIINCPISNQGVMLSIKRQGFSKEVSVEVPFPDNTKVCVNAFAKNKVSTLHMLCPSLSSISCLNEAYLRNTRKTNNIHVCTQEKSRTTAKPVPIPYKPEKTMSFVMPNKGRPFTGEQFITFPRSKKKRRGKKPFVVPVVGHAGNNEEIRRHVYIYSCKPLYDMTATLSSFCKVYANHHILDCAGKPDWSSIPNITQLLVLANLDHNHFISFTKFMALANRSNVSFMATGGKSKRVRFSPQKDMQLIVLSSCSPYKLFGKQCSKQMKVVINSDKMRNIDQRFAVCRLDGSAKRDRLLAESTIQNNRPFVCHSNKVLTGPGSCTFSRYKTQDERGLGSCINALNFHTSGNYLELCISSAVVELDLMKSNPRDIYPLTLPVRVHRNTCTTVDLHGLLNPLTALSRTKMTWDSGSVFGPTKTTSFPAYNVFVKHPEAVDDIQSKNVPPSSLPLDRHRTKETHFQSNEEDGDNYKPRASKKPRAYAVFDEKGIICTQDKYTLRQMKAMMKRLVSWELHKNNINTSFFHGDLLIDRLQSVLSWYLGHNQVEIDSKKQNFIASVERQAHALLPFSILFLAEIQYIMRNTPTAADLNVTELFISRSMICTYGGFSRGNAYTQETSKSFLSYISMQYKLPWMVGAYNMNEHVLSELVKMKEIDMGQIRSRIKNITKKKNIILCSKRKRAEGLVSSLMYGPEAFVRMFLKTVPVLQELQRDMKNEACDSRLLVSLLNKNYGCI